MTMEEGTPVDAAGGSDATLAPVRSPSAADASGPFDAFYADQAPQAMRLALLLTSSTEDAHDVAHDAFVGMLQRWHQIDDPRAYLRRSINNGAATTYRRRAGHRHREERLRSVAATEVPSPDEYLADQIAALPYAQRAVVVLKFFADLTEREIAAATGMRPGSVGPTLNRALAQLRKETDR